MALHRYPRTARGDAHGLVVVAVGTTTGKSIVQPEIPRFRDAIGNIGKARRALVRSDHEIRVLPVMDNHAFGVNDFIIHDVVGDRQQGADEHFVAGLAFGGPRFAVLVRRWQQLGVEAALCARWHNDGILDPLGFHQAEDFGAEIVPPVRPAKAAAGHWPGAQVDAFHPARIDENLAPRHWLRHIGHQRGIDLECQRFGGGGGKHIGPQNGIDDGLIQAQQPVIVNRGYLRQALLDGLLRRLRGRITVTLEGRVVAGVEQINQRHGHRRRAAQRIDHGIDGKAHADLAQITVKCPKPVSFSRRKAGADHQTVECVIFGRGIQDSGNRLFDGIATVQQASSAVALGQGENIIMDGAKAPVIQFRWCFCHDPETEIFQRRDRIGQRQRAFVFIDFQPQLVFRISFQMIQPRIALHHMAERMFRFGQVQMAHPQDVARSLRRAVTAAVANRKCLGITGGNGSSAPRLARGKKFAFHRFRPAAQHVLQTGFNVAFAIDIVANIMAAANIQHEAQHGQIAAFHLQAPIQQFGIGALFQQCLDLHPHLGGQHIARQPDKGEQMA